MLNDEDLKEEWDKHVKEESKLDKELLAACEAGRAIIGNSNFYSAAQKKRYKYCFMK